MAWTDNLQKEIEKKKQENEKRTKKSNGTAIDNLISEGTQEILNNVDFGQIQIRDMTDLKSIFDITNKIKEHESDEDGGGKLPPLNTGMENIIEKAVHVNFRNVRNEDGTITQEKTISASDIANMSSDAIEQMLMDKDTLQNNENADKII